ncbi:acyl-CoA N-acyltransferase [Hesseltinella vesiculosa]|uniref:Acyl-CoA N-acyltransferase n=1 Tax=Hesseltinella vesiculosa TaxID=101127 RepID=A0A1X2G7D6_9FUNG|nr:acyl-CoA N-acyltransferase [Hesseltinella vesiculosa]
MATVSDRYLVRRGEPLDDDFILDSYYKMYLEMGFKAEEISPDWRKHTLDTLNKNRQELEAMTFVATDIQTNKVVGCGVCQLHNTDSLHPHIFNYSRIREGYIWSIYVEPTHRRHGLATQLVAACNDYFRDIGVTVSRLFASNAGRPVYEGLGFAQVNEFCVDMSLSLPK